jgi:hypothetical protein
MAKNFRYTFDELVVIYAKYAGLKGWNTKLEFVKDHVDSWLSKSLGPVGLAISFHETGIDDYSDHGLDAGARLSGAHFQAIVFKLAGTNYKNEDGGSRIEAALGCKPFQVLSLKQEPKNIHDPRAMAILERGTSIKLGYIPRNIVGTVLNYARQGYVFTPCIIGITETKSLRMALNGSDFLGDFEVEVVLYAMKLSLGEDEINRLAEKWQVEYRSRVGIIDWSDLLFKVKGPNPDSIDPYVCLGLDRGFTEEQLKIAYKELAKKFHPDLHLKEVPEKKLIMASRMVNINAAYEVLRLRA